MKTIATLLLLGSVAGATPITYNISGTGSGSIYAAGADPQSDTAVSTFTTFLFSLNLVSDTSAITPLPSAGFITSTNTGNMTLGVSGGTFTNTVWLFDVDASKFAFFYFGIMADAIDAVMNMDAPAFATYDLSSTLGPISVAAQVNPNQRFASFIPTSFGEVVFSNLSDVTFEATTATPEPASCTLFGLGLVGFWLFRRRVARS